MKLNKLLLVLAMFGAVAHAAPPIGKDVQHVMEDAVKKYGLSGFRMVMPGVLYRGGSTELRGGPEGRRPMRDDSIIKLCEDGFTASAYGYSKGFEYGSSGKVFKCSAGDLSYQLQRWDRPNEVHDMLVALHGIITSGKGAMYVHCWYGVHSSGMLAMAALRQFCGLTADEAITYWKTTIGKGLDYDNIKGAIKALKIDPDLEITAEQRSRVCLSKEALFKKP